MISYLDQHRSSLTLTAFEPIIYFSLAIILSLRNYFSTLMNYLLIMIFLRDLSTHLFASSYFQLLPLIS